MRLSVTFTRSSQRPELRPDKTSFLTKIESLEARRMALVDTARMAFHEQVQAVRTDEEKNDINLRWSEFEELAGDLPRAAELAHASQELERAIGLYRSAGRFASAIEVANSADQDQPATHGDERRAEILEEAGDLAGAAKIYAKVGRRDDAVRCYESAGMPGKAVDLLAAEMSEDECANNARYISLMETAGRRQQLVDLILANTANLELGSPGIRFIETKLQDGKLTGPFLELARQTLQNVYGPTTGGVRRTLRKVVDRSD